MIPQSLTLDSECLEEFVDTMNAALLTVTNRMIQKRMFSGTVNASIKIGMLETKDQETGEIFYRLEIEPEVKTKIGSNSKMKCRKEDKLIARIGRDGMAEIMSEQISMDDIKREGA